MFDLEPDEIARLLEERHAVLESIGDGIIATDQDLQITLINRVALDLTGVTPKVLGRPMEEVLPQSRFRQALNNRRLSCRSGRNRFLRWRRFIE